ncbi:MAG: hypothetical protein BWX66_01996 [Deltaproteobacteria bacterium ADurb.Bin058]|nr:MAG: hypothetical protein BWX66_01996 [Deltaproteobacteria bacterium ADurb.Bin058]
MIISGFWNRTHEGNFGWRNRGRPILQINQEGLVVVVGVHFGHFKTILVCQEIWTCKRPQNPVINISGVGLERLCPLLVV